MLQGKFSRPLTCLLVFLAALFFAPVSNAHYCWIYSAGLADLNVQMPWTTANPQNACVSTNALHPVGNQTNQIIGDTHRNWHCTFPVTDTDAYGRAFIAFHRQLILEFDIERISNGTPTIQTWDPFPNVPVPGNHEDLTAGYTHCQTSVANGGADRPQAALCAGCQNLPSDFIGSSLGDFDSLGHVGRAVEGGGGPTMPQPFGWHGSYHGGVSSLGCPDVGGFIHTTYDPAFWMAHKKLDDLAWDWQSLQATDVVIVLDRSGSMDDNCDAIPPTPGTDCAIEDAKDAAKLFADLMLDVRMDGAVPAANQHRIGLVSYNGITPASINLPMTPANGVAGAFNAAINLISAGGGTSIGSGIRQAISMLNGLGAGANSSQAILVLTDGKENTAPCIEGATAPCVSGDVITNAEVGQIQIVSIGFGPGAEEYHLRRLAERHGGIFLAQSDLSAPLDLAKFFVTAHGSIFDAAVAVDPRGTFVPGQKESERFEIEMCGADDRLSVVLGFDETRSRECRLELELFTPSGKQVDLAESVIETGAGRDYHFIHANAPYAGESKGTWSGRVVRPGGRGEEDRTHAASDASGASGEHCGEQEYFYSSLVRGLGRVRPVGQPDTTVGRRILATFRMTESNRPIGDWDEVKATVTVFPPGGKPSTHRLYDDGTHGDLRGNNNYWTVELPEPTRREGVHHLRGHFELTKDGCTRVREAEYSVTVQPPPKQCSKPLCSDLIRVQPGEVKSLGEFGCVVNTCAYEDYYQVTIKDSEGWLRTLGADGSLIDWSGKPFKSGVAEPGHEACFGNHDVQLFSVAPKNARINDSTEIVTTIWPLADRGGEEMTCVTNIVVGPPPDCDGDGIGDAEEIARGTAKDANGDGYPDECGKDIHHHFKSVDPKAGHEGHQYPD